MEEKRCSKCKETKPVSQFYKTKKQPDGFQCWCKVCKSDDEKRRRRENAEAVHAKDKEYRERNPEAYKQYRAERRNSDRESFRKYHREYNSARKSNDLLFKLAQQTRTLIGNSLARMNFTKRSKTATILGCSFEEFKQHLEKQFADGMSWDNRCDWHIDHIIPVSSAKTGDEVLKLNHFSNLRPLWAEDNIRKGCKMPSCTSNIG